MENRRKAIIAVSVIGILIGIFCIIVSGIVFSENGGTYTKRFTYGGDAYTGIQNAAANTSNNVALLHNLVALVSGYAFLIVGLIMIWKSICKLVESNACSDKKTGNTSNYECNQESATKTQSQATVGSEERINMIERLRSQGLITEEEYQQAISKEQ
ncbi:MAG: hypothetical protein E7626_02285 [Ruminococcaceae bacterium]|nr:hypothetical protein [Oscillospiraceae bacterium]